MDLPSLSLLVDKLFCLLLSSFVSLSLSQVKGSLSHCDTKHKFSLSHTNWTQVSVQIEYRAQVSVSFYPIKSEAQVFGWSTSFQKIISEHKLSYDSVIRSTRFRHHIELDTSFSLRSSTKHKFFVSFTLKSGHKFSSGTQVVSSWCKTQVLDILLIHRKSRHKLSSGP